MWLGANSEEGEQESWLLTWLWKLLSGLPAAGRNTEDAVFKRHGGALEPQVTTVRGRAFYALCLPSRMWWWNIQAVQHFKDASRVDGSGSPGRKHPWPRCLFYLFILNFLSILLCCVSFRCTAKWISYTYTYVHSFLDSFPSHAISEYWIEFPALCSRSLLVIYFIYNSVYVLSHSVMSNSLWLHGL